MDVELSWKGRMAFEAAANSGHAVMMDTVESAGGEGRAASPMEYIAFGLAGCTAMDVVSILQKKRQQLRDFQVKVHLGRAREGPKVFTDAVIEYVVAGNDIEEAALVRAIELSATKYCPAVAMLSNAFPMEFRYAIHESSRERPVVAGIWQPTTQS